MPLEGLVLRSSKSEPLTNEEGDGNLTAIKDFVDAQEARVNGLETLLRNLTENYAESNTGSDDYSVTLSYTPAAWSDLLGKTIKVKPDVSNADELATLSVNGPAGMKAIKKNGADNIAAADIKAGKIALLVYDGTNMQLLNP